MSWPGVFFLQAAVFGMHKIEKWPVEAIFGGMTSKFGYGPIYITYPSILYNEDRVR